MTLPLARGLGEKNWSSRPRERFEENDGKPGKIKTLAQREAVEMEPEHAFIFAAEFLRCALNVSRTKAFDPCTTLFGFTDSSFSL